MFRINELMKGIFIKELCKAKRIPTNYHKHLFPKESHLFWWLKRVFRMPICVLIQLKQPDDLPYMCIHLKKSHRSAVLVTLRANQVLNPVHTCKLYKSKWLEKSTWYDKDWKLKISILAFIIHLELDITPFIKMYCLIPISKIHILNLYSSNMNTEHEHEYLCNSQI